MEEPQKEKGITLAKPAKPPWLSCSAPIPLTISGSCTSRARILLDFLLLLITMEVMLLGILALNRHLQQHLVTAV